MTDDATIGQDFESGTRLVYVLSFDALILKDQLLQFNPAPHCHPNQESRRVSNVDT